MAQYNVSTTLDSLWKEVYADSVENVIPESAVLQKMIPFREAEKVGDKFIQPVMLSQEHGVTYLGSNSGVATLVNHVAATYKEAQVDGSGLLLRSAISYSAANKMASSKKAFMNWSEMLVTNMVDSISKRNEIGMLYGQSGLGIISAVSDSSGTNTLTISDFCDGIWAGMEGATLDAYDGDTKQNTNAVLVVSSVNFDNGTVTVTGNTTDTAALAISDVLFFAGSKDGATENEMAGIDAIVTNTGSLFNISASTYGLWKGTTHAAGGAALNLSKLLAGVAKAQVKGQEGDLLVLVNPKTFANLNSDQAALRRYDSSYKYSKAESGSDELCFYSGNGKLIVKSHLYVKPVEAFGVPLKVMKRIGATDITFKLNNAAAGGEIFLHIPDKSGYELRCMSELAVFCSKPAHLIKWTGIVNA